MSGWVRSKGCIALVVFCALFGQFAVAQNSADFVPSLLKDEWYSEGWDQLFYFDDGTFLAIQVSVVNLGLGSRHAAVLGLVVTPEKEVFLLKQSRSHGEWDYSQERLDLKIAKHTLAGGFPDYRVHVLKNEGEIELDFTSLVPAWTVGRAGNNEDYRYVSFYAPMADASARYRLAPKGTVLGEVEWTELKAGRGFGLRYVNSTAIYDLIRSATHIVSMERDRIQPVIYLTSDEDGEVKSSLALFENGKLMLEAADFDVSIDYKLETADDDERNIPRLLDVDIVGKDFSLKGKIEIGQLLVRFDPVDHLKPLVRTIVKILNTPIQYRYLVHYDLDYRSDGRSTALEGSALMDHVVMRHTRDEQTNERNSR